MKKLLFIILFLLIYVGQADATPYYACGTWINGTGDINYTTNYWPSCRTDGDILILIFETKYPDDIPTPGSWSSGGTGWAEISNSPQYVSGCSGNQDTQISIFWKRRSGADTNITITDPGDHFIATMFAFRGTINSGNPIDVSAGSTEGTATTSVSITGTTTTGDDELIVAAIADGYVLSSNAHISGWTNANLTSVTEIFDQSVKITGKGGGIGVATGVKASAGAYGATTATLLNNACQAKISFALKPPSPPNYWECFSTSPVCSGATSCPGTEYCYATGAGAGQWQEVGTGTIDGNYMYISSASNEKLRIASTSTNTPYAVLSHGSDTNVTYATINAMVQQMDIATDGLCKTIFAGYTNASAMAWQIRVCRVDPNKVMSFQYYASSTTQTDSTTLSTADYDFINNPVELRAKYDISGITEWQVWDVYGNELIDTSPNTGLSGMRPGVGKWVLGCIVSTSATCDVVFDGLRVGTQAFVNEGWSFASGISNDCSPGSTSSAEITTDLCTGTPSNPYKYTCTLGSSYEFQVKTNWYQDGTTIHQCGISADERVTWPNASTAVDIVQTYNNYPMEVTADVAPTILGLESLVEYIHNLNPSRRVKIYNDTYADLSSAMVVDGSWHGLQIVNGYRTGSGTSTSGDTDNGFFILIFPPDFDSSRSERYPILVANHGTGYTPYQMFYKSNSSCTADDTPWPCCEGVGIGTCPASPGIIDHIVNSVEDGGTGYIGLVGSIGGEKAQGFNSEWLDAFNDAIQYLYENFNADRGKIVATGASRGGGSSFMEAINHRNRGVQHSSYSNSANFVDADGRNLLTDTGLIDGYAYQCQTIKNMVDGSTGTITGYTTTVSTSDTLEFNSGCTASETPCGCCTGEDTGTCNLTGGTDNDWDAGDWFEQYRIIGIFAGAPPTTMGDHSLAEDTIWHTMQLYYPPYTSALTYSNETHAFDTAYYSMPLYPPHCSAIDTCDVAPMMSSIVNSSVISTANTNSPYGYLDTSAEIKKYLGGYCSPTNKGTFCSTDSDCSGGDTCVSRKNIVLAFGTNDSIIPYYTLLQLDGALRDENLPHKTSLFVMGGHAGEFGQSITDNLTEYLNNYLKCANNPSPCSEPTLYDGREYWMTDLINHDPELVYLEHTEAEGVSLFFTLLVPSILDSDVDANEHCTGSSTPYTCCSGAGAGTCDSGHPYDGAQQPAQMLVSGEYGSAWQIQLLNSSKAAITGKIWKGTFGDHFYLYGTEETHTDCQLYGKEYCLIDDVQYGCGSPPCLYYYEVYYRGKKQDVTNTPFYNSTPNSQCTASATPWTCCTGSGTGTCTAKALYTCVESNQATASAILGELSDTNYCDEVHDGEMAFYINMGLTSLLPDCGDGSCQAWEDIITCPEDCSPKLKIWLLEED